MTFLIADFHEISHVTEFNQNYRATNTVTVYTIFQCRHPVIYKRNRQRIIVRGVPSSKANRVLPGLFLGVL